MPGKGVGEPLGDGVGDALGEGVGESLGDGVAVPVAEGPEFELLPHPAASIMMIGTADPKRMVAATAVLDHLFRTTIAAEPWMRATSASGPVREPGLIKGELRFSHRRLHPQN
ncbi:MAG: hypothetical protein ACLQAT_18160 [Candidatus Binataceae bacterium]